MKICPFCAKETDNENIFCGYCGRKLPVVLEEVPAALPKSAAQNTHLSESQASTRTLIIIGILIAIALPCSFCYYSVFGGDGGTSSSSSELGETGAYVICKSFVKDSLKSPGTADFPFLEYEVTKQGTNSFSVKSYVDAQNSFGANIRTYFVCRITFRGGDWSDRSNWTLDSLTFN